MTTIQQTQNYLDARSADPELAAMNARYEQASDPAPDSALPAEQAPGKPSVDTAHHEGPGIVDQQHGALFQLWRAVSDPTRLGPNALAGSYDTLKYLGSTALDLVDLAAKHSGTPDPTGLMDTKALAEQQPGEAKPALPPTKNLVVEKFPEFFGGLEKLRHNLQKDSDSGDVMVQKTWQFALPFALGLKWMGFAETPTLLPSIAEGTIGKIAKVAIMDFLANEAVWDPHETRFGDLLVEFSQDPSTWNPAAQHTWREEIAHVRDKIVRSDLVSTYTNYVLADPGETEWEGRWKNAVDSAVLNLWLTPALGAVIKTSGIILRGARNAIQRGHALGDVSQGISEWIRSGEVKTPRATIEIMSTSSPAGQRIQQGRDLASKMNDQTFEPLLISTQVEGLQKARRSGVFERLAEAIHGRPTMLTGIEAPTSGRPFDFSGTYDGGLSPNVRVPLAGMTDDELRMMNAVVGTDWFQQAGAISEVRAGVDWSKAPPKGYTRGASVFVAEPDADASWLAVKMRGAIPPEHEFAVHRTDQGFVFDIFPRFTDQGAVGISKAEATRAAQAMGLKADVVAHDYRSIYTESVDYEAAIKDLENELSQSVDARTGREGWTGKDRRDLLAEARAELQQIRAEFEGKALAGVDALEAKAKGLSFEPNHQARSGKTQTQVQAQEAKAMGAGGHVPAPRPLSEIHPQHPEAANIPPAQRGVPTKGATTRDMPPTNTEIAAARRATKNHPHHGGGS